MERKEIRRAEWEAFVEGFSRRHRGWLADVGVIDTGLLETVSDVDACLLNRAAVFAGLALETRGGERLEVLLGPPGHSSHTLRTPRRVYLEEEPGGAEQGLRVDDGEGNTLLLRFRAAPAPDAVNCLADTER